MSTSEFMIYTYNAIIPEKTVIVEAILKILSWSYLFHYQKLTTVAIVNLFDHL